MNKETLNNLKNGEQIVEMQECTLHEMNVIEVTLYTCISRFGFRKIKTYTFPFYFTSKELVEGFLKFYNYFEICRDKLRWNNEPCISLKVSTTGPYHMVDAFKKQYYYDNYYNYRYCSCSLEDKGIWGGELNSTADMYVGSMKSNYDYMKLLDKCNIPVKSEKTYTFKMIENG